MPKFVARASATQTLLVVFSVGILAGQNSSRATASDETLPATEPLAVQQPLDQLMIEGLTRFCLRELARSPELRDEKWSLERETPESFGARSSQSRLRFRQLIGAVDNRTTVDGGRPSDFELITTFGRSSIMRESSGFVVHRVRWPVLEGISAEGLLIVPKLVRAAVVAIPDADVTPEDLCGLSDDSARPNAFIAQLAEAGCLIVIPALISRSCEFSGHAGIARTNQPHREFIYRQAFEVGRHIIGYEVQKILAAIDLIETQLVRKTEESQHSPRVIGVMGIGEGGLLALYAAAIDTRIEVCWVGGYFQQRENIWQEPIYRNVWGLLTEFGDAELAGMIAPRRLIIESCRTNEISGPPEAGSETSDVAAPGRIATCSIDSVASELNRAQRFFTFHEKSEELISVITDNDGRGNPGNPRALKPFVERLGVSQYVPAQPAHWTNSAIENSDGTTLAEYSKAREERQFNEMQDHIQKLLVSSHQMRDSRWRMNPASAAHWKQEMPSLREQLQHELIGKLPHLRINPHPRSRRIIEHAEYDGYEVVLDVFDDVIAAGILLIPHNIRDGEKRPVVVCQHGLEGVPLDTISREETPFRYYKAFSEELAKQGFIVYAPQNPYRGGHQFRQLQRMSNPLQRSLFSYIIAQHEQTLDWLCTLPQVDEQRIAFYGLSYGGKTAMRVPPFVQKYCLSICSGDFTDWPRTVASNNERFSYLFTSEYEVFEWNLAHTASYAELAMMMTPRPFMVEEGHRDSGQPSEWVAGEFGKVRRHYDQLGSGDRAVLEFFDGPHTINGKGTFEFLRRHLKPPEQP